MFAYFLLSLFPSQQPSTDFLPHWFAVALAAIAAGTLTRKQRRKLRWKLAWQMAMEKMGFRKNKKEKADVGLIILMVILLLVSFGTAIWLGMLKEFLILIGAFLLFFVLLAGAFKREHGHL
jgi:hypothetical protein